MTSTKNKAPEYFVSQWGYEQTNVSFYKVLKRTAKTVTLIEVKSRVTYIDAVNYLAVPINEVANQAKAFRRKIMDCYKNCDVVSLNSYANAYQWDGTAAEGSSGY